MRTEEYRGATSELYRPSKSALEVSLPEHREFDPLVQFTA